MVSVGTEFARLEILESYLLSVNVRDPIYQRKILQRADLSSRFCFVSIGKCLCSVRT